MRPEPARWCAKCHLRIAVYDLRTVYNKTAYHQNCFLMLVREEADREKAQRAEPELAEMARGMSAKDAGDIGGTFTRSSSGP